MNLLLPLLQVPCQLFLPIIYHLISAFTPKSGTLFSEMTLSVCFLVRFGIFRGFGVSHAGAKMRGWGLLWCFY